MFFKKSARKCYVFAGKHSLEMIEQPDHSNIYLFTMKHYLIVYLLAVVHMSGNGSKLKSNIGLEIDTSYTQ